MHVLIDADIVTYMAGFASETRFYLDTKEWMVYPSKKAGKEAGAAEEDLEIQQLAKSKEWAKLVLKNTMNGIIRGSKASSFSAYLTHKDITKNFRNDVAVTYKYKGNRTKYPKPAHYQYMRDLLISEYGAIVVEGHEADDELGLRQTEDTLIASIDKDLLMIPGRHYNISTREFITASDPGELKIIRRGKKAVLKGFGFKWFCAQMLLGDDVDNIIGINRYGPVRAEKVLSKAKTPKDMWKAIEKVYKAKSTVNRMKENASLLWMMRPDAITYEDYLRR